MPFTPNFRTPGTVILSIGLALGVGSFYVEKVREDHVERRAFEEADQTRDFVAAIIFLNESHTALGEAHSEVKKAIAEYRERPNVRTLPDGRTVTETAYEVRKHTFDSVRDHLKDLRTGDVPEMPDGKGVKKIDLLTTAAEVEVATRQIQATYRLFLNELEGQGVDSIRDAMARALALAEMTLKAVDDVRESTMPNVVSDPLYNAVKGASNDSLWLSWVMFVVGIVLTLWGTVRLFNDHAESDERALAGLVIESLAAAGSLAEGEDRRRFQNHLENLAVRLADGDPTVVPVPDLSQRGFPRRQAG